MARLQTIPGVAQRTAEILVAEVGLHMARFPTAAHLISWPGLCPGNNESASQRKRGTTRKGCTSPRVALIEAALAAMRTKGCALGARCRRVIRQRGHKKAMVAVAHSILEIAYHLLASEPTYHELRADYFDRRDKERATRRYVRLLEHLGHRVTLEPTSLVA